MNILKVILALIGVILGGWLLLSVISIIYGALFYLFIFAIVAIGGMVGYKLLVKDRVLELEEKTAVSRIELDNAKIVKDLEEIKRKYVK